MESTSNLTAQGSDGSIYAEEPSGTSSNQSVVYFLGTGNGLVKIGFASNFKDRLGKLCAGSPVSLLPLAIVRGGRTEEREYHARFKRWRHHAEWFYLTDEIEDEIDRINSAQSLSYRPHRLRGMALPLTLTMFAAVL